MGNSSRAGDERAELGRLGYVNLPSGFDRSPGVGDRLLLGGLPGAEVTGFDQTAEVADEIRTDRLGLRPLGDEDRPALARLVADDADALGASDLVPAQATTLADPDAFSTWLDELAFLRAIDQRYDVAVVAGGELVGMVGLHSVVRGHLQCAWLAAWIGSPAQDQGYAVEACRGLLGFAFGGLGLHRVEAAVLDGNQASQAGLRTIGFRDLGVSPRYLEVNRVWRDHRRFELTAEEWAG